ncbi:response regulator [Aeoliella sp.]|uniref:response regulator n=1 Tax=Aeoliella sp. TaxID=2795800 RepID=UPI003CCC38C0
MLVITRRSSDRISFPQFGVTVHFLRVRGGGAKVGIEAPRDIDIVRDEVAGNSSPAKVVRDKWLRLPKKVRHAIRNELHMVSVGMHLYRQQVANGDIEEADLTFSEIQDAIRRIDDNEALRNGEKSRGDAVEGTVLLVEDNDNEREMLSGLLRLSGYHVVSLGTVEDTLQYINSNAPPAIVLVDMMLHDRHGSEIVSCLRSNGATQPWIIAVSGSAPEDCPLPVGREGIDRWFRKPVNPQFLLEAMHEPFKSTEVAPLLN